MSDRPIHGTLTVQGSHHPVLDIEFWKRIAPLGDKRKQFGSIETPVDLVLVEQARQLASGGQPFLGVPVDMFVWALATPRQPFLTKLGGLPWMEKGAQWPCGEDGRPLAFIGQICFLDSLDLLESKPPGDVALFFSTWSQGYVGGPDVIVWSSRDLKDPLKYASDAPDGALLAFEYSGVRHRSFQFVRTHAIDREGTEETEAAFEAAGFPDGSFELADPQVTQIGNYAGLPQGWPFEPEDESELICVLSEYGFSGAWPLCDVPHAPQEVRADGTPMYTVSWSGLSLHIGDAGVIYVYKDKCGQYKVDSVCG